MDTKLSAEFANYLAQTDAVKFGDFRLKSGKQSDIFFNFGNLCLGTEFATLGSFFAKEIVNRSLHKVDAITYNRTKFKEHGEGGSFVGYDLSTAQTVLVVDDVITDGLTKYETIKMLSVFPQLTIKAFLIGVDREDADDSGKLWAQKFVSDTGIPLHTITTRTEVIQHRDSREMKKIASSA